MIGGLDDPAGMTAPRANPQGGSPVHDRLSIGVLVAVLIALLFRLQIDAGFSLDTLRTSTRLDAGASTALPPEVLDARRIVDELGLEQVRLAGRFEPHVDMYLHQRFTEYAYPVRNLHTAPDALLLLGDALPAPSCRVIARGSLTQVVRCD